jgi:signal transduction histidine kinase
LHSSTLDNLGLAEAVRALCEEFEDHYKIEVSFVEGNVPRDIQGEGALCLFRVVQEALQNVRKHSLAERAEVRVEGLTDKIHLSVCDRGKGFDPSNGPQDGIGIRSMEQRLRLVNGQFAIRSSPTEGTRIDAWVPI